MRSGLTECMKNLSLISKYENCASVNEFVTAYKAGSSGSFLDNLQVYNSTQEAPTALACVHFFVPIFQ